jgi:outer membrane protein OmpA-like peptidoglycan-associated protein
MSSSWVPMILIALLAACEPSPRAQPAAAPAQAAAPSPQPTPLPPPAPAVPPAPPTPAVIASPAGSATSPSRPSGPAPAPPKADATPGQAPERGRVTVTTSDECGFVLDSLYFPESSTVLPASQEETVAHTAEMFRCMWRTHEVTRWQVIGNADARERDPVRMALDRGHAVEKALIAHGVVPGSLEVVTVGASDPLDTRGTPSARAKNRRVNFLVLTRGSP